MEAWSFSGVCLVSSSTIMARHFVVGARIAAFTTFEGFNYVKLLDMNRRDTQGRYLFVGTGGLS